MGGLYGALHTLRALPGQRADAGVPFLPGGKALLAGKNGCWLFGVMDLHGGEREKGGFPCLDGDDLILRLGLPMPVPHWAPWGMGLEGKLLGAFC